MPGWRRAPANHENAQFAGIGGYFLSRMTSQVLGGTSPSVAVFLSSRRSTLAGGTCCGTLASAWRRERYGAPPSTARLLYGRRGGAAVARGSILKPTAAPASILGVMPRISAFYGMVITMYWRDHPPAHFHASYAGHVAKIEIESLELLDGWLPPRGCSAAAQGVGGAAPRRAPRRLGPRPRPRRPAPDRPAALGLPSWSQ